MHFSGANTADFGKLHLGYGVFLGGGGAGLFGFFFCNCTSTECNKFEKCARFQIFRL